MFSVHFQPFKFGSSRDTRFQFASLKMLRRKLFSSILSLNTVGRTQIRHKVGSASGAFTIQDEIIRITNNQRKYSIDTNLMKLQVEKIYDFLKIEPLHIAIVIAGNKEMRDSYEEAFQKRKTTDILAWAPQNVRVDLFCCSLPVSDLIDC